MSRLAPIRLTVLVALLGSILAPPLRAAEVRGRVFDSDNNAYLRDAQIRIVDTVRETNSAQGGTYIIRGLDPGEYVVEAVFLGYPSQTQRVVLVSENDSKVVDFTFGGDEIVELESFEVTGSALGQARALNQQRAAENYTNIVASDAMGNFVDRNAAEALQRLPGIMVEEDQGEGRFIVIRGADPTLNNVEIDGVGIATPETDGRSTGLNLISIDQLESIEVSKTWLPSESANTVGGSVNLVTRSALTRGERYFKIEAAGGKYAISDEPSYRISGVYGDYFKHEKLGEIGIQFTVTNSLDNRGSDTLQTTGWDREHSEDIQQTPDGFVIEGYRMEDFEIERERLGFSTKLEYRPSPNHEFHISLSRNEFNDDEILQATGLALSNGFQSFAGPRVLNEEVALALGYDLDDPEIQDRLNSPVIVNKALRFDEAVALGVLEFDEETRNYTHTQLSGDGRKFWESKLVTDEIFTYQFGGEHAFGDALDIDYKIYSSEANKEVAEQRMRMDANGASFDVRLLEGTFRPVIVEIGEKKLDRASTFGLTDDRGFVEDNTSFSDDLRNGFKVNGNWSKQSSSAEWNTSFGLAMDFRDKGFQNNLKRFSQIDSADSNRISLENDVLYGGDLGPILTDLGDDYIYGPLFDTTSARSFINDPGDFEFAQSPDDLTATVTDRVLSNCHATEDVTAAYLMEKVRFGKWKFIAGLRYEKTENTYTVNTINTFDENDRFIQPNRWRFFDEDVFLSVETFSRSYENWSPAFHVNYDWTEDIVIRASATQTIARPEFTKVIPNEIIEVSSASFSRRLRLPNFELMPMESTNLDLSVEHFSKSLGLASVAFFYKKLDGAIYDESRILGPSDPISQALAEKYTARGLSSDDWNTHRYANAGGGRLLGVEFTLNRRLTFLPAPFDSFGFNFNASFIESSVELLLEERLNEEVPLFKQASNLGNLSVYFERWGLDVRLSYFWRSEFLRNVSAGRELIGDLQDEGKLGLTADALDVYEGAFQRFDLLVQYTWRGFTIFFEGTNLGNEPKLHYDGNPSRFDLVQYTQPIYFGGMKFDF